MSRHPRHSFTAGILAAFFVGAVFSVAAPIPTQLRSIWKSSLSAALTPLVAKADSGSSVQGSFLNINLPAKVQNSPAVSYKLGTTITLSLTGQGNQGNGAGYSKNDLAIYYKKAGAADTTGILTSRITQVLAANTPAATLTSSLNTASVNGSALAAGEYQVWVCIVPVGGAATASSVCDKYVNIKLYSPHTISGTISNTAGGSVTGPLSGISVVLSGAPSSVTSPVTTNASGVYTFSDLPDGITYTVTPSAVGYTFGPLRYSNIAVIGANVTGLNFLGSLPAVPAPVADCSRATGGAFILFSDRNCQGTQLSVPVGTYLRYLPDQGFNDIASSLFVPGTTAVSIMVYENADRNLNQPRGKKCLSQSNGGTHWDLSTAGTSDQFDTGLNMNDQISSLETFANGTCTPNPVTYTISGHIQTSTGSAVAGVTLTYISDISQNPTPAATTDAAGNYTTIGLTPNHNYVLTPSKTGITFSPISSAITLVTTRNVTGINFTGTLPSTVHSISGHIANSDPTDTVTITGGVASVHPNAAGDYTIPNVRDGSYTLAVTTVTVVNVGQLTVSPASAAITLSGANLGGQNFTVQGYTISGRIASAAGIAAQNESVYVHNSSLFQTNTNGVYTTPRLPPAAYVVEPLLFSSTNYYNPRNIDATVSNANLINKNFTVIPGSLATGKVTDMSGNILLENQFGYITVDLTDQRTSEKITTTAYNGTFDSRLILNDSYAATVRTDFGEFTFGTYAITTASYVFPPFHIVVPQGKQTHIVVDGPAFALPLIPADVTAIKRLAGGQSPQTFHTVIENTSMFTFPAQFWLDPAAVWDIVVAPLHGEFQPTTITDIFGTSSGHAKTVINPGTNYYFLGIGIDMVCTREKAVGSVDLCFEGALAGALADDSANTPVWQGMADEMDLLRDSTRVDGSSNPSHRKLTEKILISSSIVNNAYYRAGGSQDYSYEITILSGLLNAALMQGGVTQEVSAGRNTVRHESGHELEYLVSSGWERPDLASYVSAWPSLYSRTRALSYANDIFTLEMDSTYSHDNGAGHPEENEEEDFATTIFADNQRPDRYCHDFVTKMNLLPASQADGKAILEEKRGVADRVFRRLTLAGLPANTCI
ncbi:MAG: carboxypeptidase-like regulatory domain-containing protein [bacterium]